MNCPKCGKRLNGVETCVCGFSPLKDSVFIIGNPDTYIKSVTSAVAKERRRRDTEAAEIAGKEREAAAKAARCDMEQAEADRKKREAEAAAERQRLAAEKARQDRLAKEAERARQQQEAEERARQQRENEINKANQELQESTEALANARMDPLLAPRPKATMTERLHLPVSFVFAGLAIASFALFIILPQQSLNPVPEWLYYLSLIVLIALIISGISTAVLWFLDEKRGGKLASGIGMAIAATVIMIFAGVCLESAIHGTVGFKGYQSYMSSLGKTNSDQDDTVAADTSDENQISVGAVISFGNYEQDNNLSNGMEPIEWIVLETEGEKALVISKYALDCQPYNESNEDVTWETCTLRAWLNTEFLETAFDSTEQQVILTTTVVNNDANYMDDTGSHTTEGGNDTEDKLFLANDNYFSSREIRYCVATDYAIEKGVYLTGDTLNGQPICWWWLRYPGSSGQTTVHITDGHITESYMNVGGTWDHEVNKNDCGVRPEMWINLSDITMDVVSKVVDQSADEENSTIGDGDERKIAFAHENYYTENDNFGRNWLSWWIDGAVEYDEDSQSYVPVELSERASAEEVLDNFFELLQEDPVMFAACEGYVDTVLGTGHSGEFGCDGENYLEVMNNNAQKYYSDYESWDEHLQVLKDMFTSSGTVTIEAGADSYNRLGMISTDTIPEIILMNQSYEDGHLMVVTINIKGTEVKLKFLLETGYAPVDVEAWQSPM